MKCLICKYGFGVDRSVEEYQERTKGTCGVCRNDSHYAPKTEEDCVAEGVEIYEYKMGLPQYAAYKDNPQAAERLLMDCVQEAAFRMSINATTLDRLAAKGGANG